MKGGESTGMASSPNLEKIEGFGSTSLAQDHAIGIRAQRSSERGPGRLAGTTPYTPPRSQRKWASEFGRVLNDIDVQIGVGLVEINTKRLLEPRLARAC